MAETSRRPTKAMTSMYALGWTQHSKGSQNIRTMAMLQLILGNIGIRGGGMNALRGHSNIQGLTDIGLMSELMPGYLNIPQEKEADLKTYLSTRQFKPLRPNQTSYWQNYPKFFVSLQKAMFGDGRHRGERLGLRLHPQARQADVRRAADVRADAPGQGQRLFLPGLQSDAGVSQPGEDHRVAVQAEMAGDDGSAGYGDLAVLGEPRRLQRRGHRRDPDRSDPAADHLLRRGGRLAHQFRTLAAVALAGRHAAGRGASTTTGSWRRSSCACAISIARKAAPSPIPSST